MRIWHVNTALRGGGVAEILDSLKALEHPRNPGLFRFVPTPNQLVFGMTKRIHHRLHGNPRGELPDAAEHAEFVGWGRDNAERFLEQTDAGDVVVLHDPQTLPMLPLLHGKGLRLAWRCHIGTLAPNDISRSTWQYLRQFWTPGLPMVFSDAGMVPEESAGHPTMVIPPSINPHSAKNGPLDDATVRWLVTGAGIPDDDEPMLLQVSRWDPLKDMVGVLQAYADSPLHHRARLVLCGPSPASVADDPEATQVFTEVTSLREGLPAAVRDRVHLVCPGLDDLVGNARLVNALQRRATVVAQKSLQEGFGLTVTEAMWKARPVVAGGVGGIRSQIEHGSSGLLLDDPHDLDGFAALVLRLLDDPAEAARLGDGAMRRVQERFLVQRELEDHLRLYRMVLDGAEPATGHPIAAAP